MNKFSPTAKLFLEKSFGDIGLLPNDLEDIAIMYKISGRISKRHTKSSKSSGKNDKKLSELLINNLKTSVGLIIKLSEAL